MEAIETIGKKLSGNEQRDAIHIAIMPVVCAEDYMNAGDEVGLVYGTKNVVKRKDSVYGHQTLGVIDPFLRGGDQPWAMKGNTVWCFLTPGSITGLRHEWTRPDVDNPPAAKDEHEAWLRKFADNWNFDYDTMIAVASQGSIKSEFNIPGLPLAGHTYEQDWITARGIDLHSRSELGEDYELFWQHLEGLTGQKFAEEHREKIGWSCSC